MSSDIPLDQLLDHPRLVVAIAGRDYAFSELPLEQQARLQSWARLNTPHPIAALKGQLEGLDPRAVEVMAENARVAALAWPPRIGTAAGTAALLSTEPGQVEAIKEGLSVHQPGLPEAEARRIFRALRLDASRRARKAKEAGKAYDGEGLVKRIFAVLFGLDDPENEGDDDPKA